MRGVVSLLSARAVARAAVACAACWAFTAGAQDYGDTPYVQTPQNVVDKMLEVAGVGPRDFVIDLGSGDGRMIITAAKKYGARGFGVDLDRRLVALANRNARAAGVANRAAFHERDLYDTDLGAATVVTMYLLPEVNLMVRPRLLNLKPGTRVVAHDYDMAEWTPDLKLELDAPGKPVGRDKKSKLFFWVVPANVAGQWRWQMVLDGRTRDCVLVVRQNFQMLEGELTVDGRTLPLREGRLTGAAIRLRATDTGRSAAVEYEFTGRIIGQGIDGEVRVSGARNEQALWQAARTEIREPAHALLPQPTLQPQLR